MKYAVGREEQAQRQGKFLLSSFFFNARGVQLQRTQLGLFRSLLYQLVAYVGLLHSVFLAHCEHLGEIQQTSKESLKWNLNELRDLFEAYVCRALEVTHLKIYIDALDEGGEAAADELASFFDRLISNRSAKQSSNQGHLYICIACRHFPVMKSPSDLKITVEEDSNEAIKIHVDKVLKPLSAVWKPGEIGLIKSEVLQKAQGVFQWVAIALEKATLLKVGRSPRLILKKIKELPSALDDLYTSMLQGVEVEDRPQAPSLIRWVCFAQLPLTLSEIRIANAFDTDPPYPSMQAWIESDDYVESDEQMSVLVNSLSGGLAETVPSGSEHLDSGLMMPNRENVSEARNPIRCVQFIHDFVSDYIKSRGLSMLDNLPALGIIGSSQHRSAKACMNYIKSEEILLLAEEVELGGRRDKLGVLRIHAFSQYALGFLWSHLKLAEINGHSQEDLLHWLEYPSGRIFQACLLLNRAFDRTPNSFPVHPHILHLMCELKLMSVTRVLIEQHGVDANSKDRIRDTPLMIVAMRGTEATVRYFLDREEVDVNSQDHVGCTAVHAAVSRGRTSMLKML